MGININYCQAVPNLSGGGELCTLINDSPSIGRRDCYGWRSTPEVYSVDGLITLNDNALVSLDLGFWVGVGYDRYGGACIYVGNEDLPVCVDICSTDRRFTRDDMESLAANFAAEVADHYNISIWDVLLGILAAIVVIVLLIAVPTIGEEVPAAALILGWA